MKVSIRQRRFSLSDRYTIEVDGERKFSARRGFFSLKIYLQDESGAVKTTIRKSLVRFGKRSYSLTFPGNVRYHFHIVSSKNGIWELDDEQGPYSLYEHEGYAYSLYHKDKQIAACKKNEVVFGGGDQYELDVDFDVELERVISIFLIIDHAYFSGWGLRIAWTPKIFEDGKVRNWQWQPKDKPDT